MTKNMMVTTITFSSGLRCSWAVNDGNGMRIPLLRRNGHFATVDSESEKLEMLLQALQVCELRARSHEPVPPQSQHEVEMALVINEHWSCPDVWCTMVFADADTGFAHYRMNILRQIDDLRRTAPREPARVS